MIRDQARNGSNILIGLVLVAVAISTFVILQIRYGGPIYQKYALENELLADILPPPAYVVEPYLEATLAMEHPDQVEAKAKALAQLRKDYETRKTYWQTTTLPADQFAILKDSQVAADKFWAALEQRYLPAIRSGNLEEARRIHEAELAPAYSAQHDAILQLVEKSNNYVAAEHGHDDLVVTFSLVAVGVLMSALVGAVVLARRLIARRVVEPLAQTAHAMRHMADGDYASAIEGLDRQDEIGVMAQAMEVFRSNGVAKQQAEAAQKQVVAALTTGLSKLAAQDLEYRINEQFPQDYEVLRLDYNRALESLMEAIGTVRVGTGSLSRTIEELRVAADDLARRNEMQMNSLDATSNSIAAVAETVQTAASSASNVRESSQEAHRQASEGGAVVERAIAAMDAIEQSSQEIGQIVNVIDGIAFQTNLLALNAGVEAARAGDAGKGFAVVANEVRALAQRSADAARDIKALIGNSTAQVAMGVELVGETGGKLRDIVAQVADITGLIEEIASSAHNQAANIDHVRNSMREMEVMTQQNAAMVEQSTAATRSLSDEANKLSDMVSSFRTRKRNVRPDYVANPASVRRSTAVDNPVDYGAADFAEEVALPSFRARKAPAVAAKPAPRPAPVAVGNNALAMDEWSDF
ncbi:methyl-accepting chemotaxis protein [Novosphingobium umbonatum]|uniref:Methyl-accepting chemotaxis protein n=1 Tax=Novosphingobium umbonatum TaxID=1908524 RepID=A0A437N1T9_9SPHN|nr:HAMP domain-containing methyl-accepting chemotaxis protein [Novosphingobium umbonatum]RVU03888.1 methyl-accepting chemotaxis protein [Novosphingobium umbonatum]